MSDDPCTPRTHNDDESDDLEDFGGDGIDYSGYFADDNIFECDYDAIAWAKRTAISLGFELIIASHKKEGTLKVLTCARGARYRRVQMDMEVVLRKNTKTKACNCPFRVAAKQLPRSINWVIVARTGIKGTHNHTLVVYKEGYRQMSGLSPGAKKIVRDMTSAQARPCHILAAVKEKHPEDNSTIRHVYNYRDNLRRESFDGRDVVSQFYYLANANDYVVFQQVDPETRKLTHLFMAHHESVKLLRSYPWFIGMDTTTRRGSYSWALDNLRTLIGSGVQPTVIVTDRELGLLRPVEEIFPRSQHLLCTWHINKDVEERVYKLVGKDKDYAEKFTKGKWRRIMYAENESEYESALNYLRTSMTRQERVVKYIEDIWLMHKEKFVKAWTNNVLHFGNTTTCRVESAHAQLKQWLASSTGALDTIWAKVHKEIESQVTQIRRNLEESRRRVGAHNFGPPFTYLACKVSHYCLDILNAEFARMRELSDEVYERCGCVLRKTHGLPCACLMKKYKTENALISLDDVHVFWRLLVYDNADFDRPTNVSEDQQKFFKLAEEVSASHPAVIRNINLMINDVLHPDCASYYEPDVNTNVKGRPKKKNQDTKHIPSKWEYRDKGRGRGRSSSSSSGRGRSFSSSVHNASNVDYVGDIFQYQYVNRINPIILDYVEGYLDVVADGNCGFRVVASFIYGNEEHWRLVRESVAGELRKSPLLYQQIYFCSIEVAIGRVTWNGGACGQNHWMEVLQDLFPIATFFNAAIFFFNHNTNVCSTVLPLRAPSTATRPTWEIVIHHLDPYPHFIRLDLQDNFPAPPVATFWFAYKDASVEGWEQMYARRLSLWNSLSRYS